MLKPWIFFFILTIVIISNRIAAQNTLFDIIYCLNGGENKSVGILKMPTANPPVKPGWNLVFTDEFQSDSLNPTHWNRSDPWDDGNGSCVRNFAVNPANTTIENGSARIFNSIDAALPGCPYSGGEIKTMSVRDTAFSSFYFYAPGYLETRVKLFTKTGQGAACWLWAVGTPENPGLPGPWNEIDLFELNGVNQNIFTGTYHWTYNGIHVSQNHSIFLTDSAQLYDLATNWTTFGLEWDSASIKWFVNNTLVKELDLSQIPPFCIEAAHYGKPLAPFCIRFNTGFNTVGNQSGVANPADFPQSMQVDYVRVYKKSGQKASPIIMQDGQYQICATANSPETSDKIIRVYYYPDASYEWTSPVFEMAKIVSSIPQPPEKMHIWIKPGTTTGQGYPVYLKTVFPWNYTDYDTAYIYITADLPELPPDNFTPVQLDTLCYFSITTPIPSYTEGCEFSLDNGISWIPGTIKHKNDADVCIFGKFKPEEHVEFTFREQNGCGYSPIRFSTLTMPQTPADCKWPNGINDPCSDPTPCCRVSMSPNPVIDLLTIRLSACVHLQRDNIQLRIYDLNGRNVFIHSLSGQDDQLDISFLHHGIYSIQIRTDDTIIYKSTFIRN